jgi:hypothetical protein
MVTPEDVRLIDSNDQTFASYDVTAHAGELQRRAKALMHSPSADDRRRPCGPLIGQSYCKASPPSRATTTLCKPSSSVTTAPR